ncbi:galactose oxidase [Fusarium oxysporum f. sp. raphani 54005]|uniref:Galactose oxidase n=1 Tax=Fusarium oxysporum f. sp. raphani 54005 TaxID=1089458 RepID=X0BZR2_FUSOX|nr:galactose oxidase [Fusarium oxysporum f. sp. raphani 54005]WKT50866.1 Kelch repeat type 1 [Fusarium oxysporum f. sp. vasinfectum]
MKSLWTLALYLGSASAVAISQPAAKAETPEGSLQFLSLRASAPIGTAINRDKWRVTCDSQHEGDECSKAIDGDRDTFWHTAWAAGGTNDPKPPHTITIDMGSSQNVNGLSVLPRQDGSDHGWIGRHNVFLSTDGKNWGDAVATGTWFADNTEKYSNFETRPARYVRLVAVTEANDQPWTSIAEINVFKAASYTSPQPGLGRWGPTLDFPIVPVAAAVEPTSGKVLVWSSYRNDAFGGSPGGVTLTSTWDPSTGVISQRTVTVTKHDMFCPGISMDGNGQVVVTGGNDAQKTSLYDSSSDSWIPGPDMKVARGYQSSATLSNGRVFTIGGSWSGGIFEKNGEVYDPSSKTWTSLPGALVKPMLTADQQGLYRSDNHGWLFGWKKGSVFQAGPSTAMNWYYTTGNGGVKSAGKRQSSRGTDPDAMCGNAVMYDAVKGKILTFGGSPSYQDSDATTNAHIITISEPGSTPKTVFASNGLYYPRTFHTSVVLPDGNVFITGGQQRGIPFADSTPQLTPELYVPNDDTFYKQQPNSIVRVYHSISLLLPDGRVFNGGGGLCGDCDTNHFDAQIYTPNNLYDSNGKLATRPKITKVSAKSVKVGGKITITADTSIKQASLIRYGTSTHTVNTDQRRIPLSLRRTGTGNSYSFQVPSDSGIALPGYWMLFVMNSAGVPSVASTLLVTQ